MNAYRERNALLNALGFATYAAYLKSSLWREIRSRALAFYGRQCRVCGKTRRIQVHHESDGLKVVCELHHRKAEYCGGRKVSLATANARLEWLTRKKRGRKRPGAWCAICRHNRGFQGGPCPPCRKRAESSFVPVASATP